MFHKLLKTVFALGAIAFFLGGCSEYQEVLRSDDINLKYEASERLYNAGKYKKSLGVMEQIVPAFRGRPQAEKLMFMYASTFYNLKDYLLAGYQFERFTETYPKSDSAQVAAYRSAKSYYHESPRFSLDQKDTYKAIEKLQAFINQYPASPYRTQANALVAELNGKLELKAIGIAQQNLKIGAYLNDYRPAITSFENFIIDHPGSVYRKDAYYGRLRAAYLLAINSRPALQKQRLVQAQNAHKSFLKYFAKSELRGAADKMAQDINERLALQPTS